MILCVTPNPALEHTWAVPGLYLGCVARARETLELASGKGVNASRGIRSLGEATLNIGLLSGYAGHCLAARAGQENLPARWTWLAGESETRLAWAVFDPEQPDLDATLLSGPGPQLLPRDWERLVESARTWGAIAELACISGSLPPGAPAEAPLDLVRALQTAGAAVWLDTSGDWLTRGIAGKPDGVKVNTTEAAQVAGIAVDDPASALSAAQQFHQAGVAEVIVTLGQSGAVYSTVQEAWFASAVDSVHPVSSVGSGDAFMAGLLVARLRQQSPADMLRLAAACGAANTLLPGGGRFNADHLPAFQAEVRVERLR